MSRLDEIRRRLTNDQSAQPTREEVDYLLLLLWQPDPRTWEPQHVETLCACRTFDVGPMRAYLDGCDFLHTTVRCPDEKFIATTLTAGGERCAGQLGVETAFPLSETLRLSVEWLKHLHDSHECDCTGWEQRSFLIEAAQRYQQEIASKCVFPAPEAEDEPLCNELKALACEWEEWAKKCQRDSATADDYVKNRLTAVADTLWSCAGRVRALAPAPAAVPPTEGQNYGQRWGNPSTDEESEAIDDDDD